MGIEGQESPRDVADEKQKHPWEVFPEGEASAIQEGEKKRKEKTNSNKLNLPKNKALFIGAGVLIVAIIVGAVYGINLLTKKKEVKNDGPEAIVLESLKRTTTVEDASTADLAYAIAATAMKKAASEGAFNSSGIDSTIMMDNIENFLKQQKTESDRVYYQMVAISITSLLEEFDTAKYYLDIIDELDYNSFNTKQKYAFFISHRLYYRMTEDTENFDKYDKWFRVEFPNDEYVDARTNEKIDAPEEEKN